MAEENEQPIPNKKHKKANKDEKSSKKKKKPKKDKWGQPLVDATEDAIEQEPVDETTEELNTDGGLFKSKKVVVSGMPYWASEEEIRQLFEDVGEIFQLQLSRFPDTGNFRGLAFVTFETEEAAKKSLDLDGTNMGNRFIKVERCRVDSQGKRKHEFISDPQKADGCLSAYVGNLSWDVTEDEIRDFFESSRITSLRLATDKNTGKFRGFCHVDFEDDESLEKAMRRNQVELHGRPVKISYAVSNR